MIIIVTGRFSHITGRTANGSAAGQSGTHTSHISIVDDPGKLCAYPTSFPCTLPKPPNFDGSRRSRDRRIGKLKSKFPIHDSRYSAPPLYCENVSLLVWKNI